MTLPVTPPVAVIIPVTPRVPPTVAFADTVKASVSTVPSNQAFLYCTEAVPKSRVLVVLGVRAVPETIRSCAGPTLVMGAPSPAVPS